MTARVYAVTAAMSDMLKLLGIAWTAGKLTSKRFGPVGGFVAAVVVVTGYLILDRWLGENYPNLAGRL